MGYQALKQYTDQWEEALAKAHEPWWAGGEGGPVTQLYLNKEHQAEGAA